MFFPERRSIIVRGISLSSAVQPSIDPSLEMAYNETVMLRRIDFHLLYSMALYNAN